MDVAKNHKEFEAGPNVIFKVTSEHHISFSFSFTFIMLIFSTPFVFFFFYQRLLTNTTLAHSLNALMCLSPLCHILTQIEAQTKKNPVAQETFPWILFHFELHRANSGCHATSRLPFAGETL